MSESDSSSSQDVIDEAIEALHRTLRETEAQLQRLEGLRPLPKPTLERPRSEPQALRQRSERPPPNTRTIPQIVFVLGRDARIIHSNNFWAEYSGLSVADRARDDWMDFLHVEDRARVTDAWEHANRNGAAHSTDARLRKADGQYRWWRMQAAPVMDSSGALSKWLVDCTDIDDLRRPEAELREAEILLRMAGRVARMGSWVVNFAEGFVQWSDELCEIFGVPPGTAPTLEQALDFCPEEWRNVVTELFSGCFVSGIPFDEEVQMLTASRKRIWVRIVGQAVLNEDGVLLRVRGTTQDISERKFATQESLRLATRLSTTLEMITDAFFTLDAQWCFTFLNRESERLLRRSRDELLGKSIWEEFKDSNAARWEAEFRRASRDQCTVSFDAFIPVRNLWIETQVYPSEDGLAVYARDVTAHRQAQAKLRLQAGALEAAANAIVITGRDGVIQQVNAAFTTMTGYSAEEAVGSRVGPLLNSGHHDHAFYAAMWGTIVAGRVWHGEIVNRRKDRQLYAEEMTITPLKNDDGEITHFVAVKQDITARSEAALELSRVNRALKMSSRCDETLIRTDDERELLHEICRIAVEIGGYRMAWVGYAANNDSKSITPVAHSGNETGYLEEIALSWAEDVATGRGPAGQTIRRGEVVIAEDLSAEAAFSPWLQAALERGFKGVVCLPLKNRERTFGVLALYPPIVAKISREEIELLEKLAGNLAFGIDSIRSRVEQRQTQAAVLKIAQAVSASSGAAFFDLLNRGLIEALEADGGLIGRIVDGGSVVQSLSFVVDGNKRENVAFPLTGTPSGQSVALGHCFIDRGAQRAFPDDPKLAELGIEAYAGTPLRTSDGQATGILSVFFRGPMKRPEFVMSTLRIFAARAASEMEQLAAYAQIRAQASLLDKAHDAIMVRGIDQRIVFWNQGAERLYGWTAAEALGQSVEHLLFEDPDELRDAMASLYADDEWSGEVKQRHKSGRLLTVECRWTLVRDESGKPMSILAMCSDVTERHEMEEQIKQSRRLEALGQLTGGVAHDFNNLLTVILGNADLLAEETVDDLELHTLAEMTRTAAIRGAELTHRLLAFARRQPLEPKAVNVNEQLGAMAGLLRRTLSEDIEITYALRAALKHALIDPSQLENAVLNLCINARDAMTSGGRLTIETADVELDDEYAGQHAELKAGRYVMVAVSDTGVGIAAADLERVFDPFFTTKEFGKGTGLGLSMVYGFVKQSQGHIKIYSALGLGTTVKMYFPETERDRGLTTDAIAAMSDYRGTERIVLVEDDDLVRRHAEEQLIELGYQVMSFQNGVEALSAIRRTNDIDLLFTDVVMPGGMNGPDLAAAATAARPTLKVLFTSGYTENAVLNRTGHHKSVHLLNKPYRRIDLARKIRLVLSEPQC